MDTFLIIAAIILLLIGVAGCILPFLPGPPLAYGSLILLQLTSKKPFTEEFLVIWAVVTLAVVLADYYIPIWGTKKFGGTKAGVWGATIGLVAGLFFFPPFGIIVGPFVGALAGELINNSQDTNKAFRSAFGSFIGFIAGTVMKLGVSLVMGYYLIRAVL
ncbi:MAG TPA: DUF456 domain-containing protein [Bacteroidales bacterium]|jgi:uncharacterized protein YqgC (DUF456 family)|nr:DUF456 domain-containing protein [Bacteroidales bacterium]